MVEGQTRSTWTLGSAVTDMANVTNNVADAADVVDMADVTAGHSDFLWRVRSLQT